eukprot:6172832-Pleurochrysis_carterae.AAC.2
MAVLSASARICVRLRQVPRPPLSPSERQRLDDVRAGFSAAKLDVTGMHAMHVGLTRGLRRAGERRKRRLGLGRHEGVKRIYSRYWHGLDVWLA